jgi:hypothetical protein
LITSIAKRDERVQFLDIRVILKEQGFDDVEISRLTQHVSITMTLDEAIQGNRNYRIVRLHEGVLEILETVYDEENQTLTFETDRFSNYAIMYQVDEDSSFIGILMIALILLLGLLAWYYRFFILLLFKRKKEDDEEEHKELKQESAPKKEASQDFETILKVDTILIKDVTKRATFEGSSKVEKGVYLEVTKDFESTNRIIEVENEALPNVLTSGNAFIKVSLDEAKKLSLKGISANGFVKKTPGSKCDKGYYGEVDVFNIFTGRTIILLEKLPPSSKKGHRWVRVQTRVIK